MATTAMVMVIDVSLARHLPSSPALPASQQRRKFTNPAAGARDATLHSRVS